MAAGTKPNHAVLVLSEDAAHYPPLLSALSTAGVRLDFAETAAATLKLEPIHSVLLAQPDLAANVIDQLPAVQWVQSTWAGVKPLLGTRRQDFLLTGVKDAFSHQMAEYCLGAMLAHEQKLLQRHQQQQAQTWWSETSGRIRGKTLGVLGTGSIGAQIARTAAALGMNVLGYSRSGAECDGFSKVWPASGLHDFLGQADYIVAVLPDTAETTGLVNAASFAAMKPGAVFINIGRGNLVDEAALVEALEQGQLAGAVLDVFQQEPLLAGHPLWSTPGVVITGHVAARSVPADIAGIFIDNYQRYCGNKALRYEINRERGY